MQGKASLLSMVMFEWSLVNSATSASQASRSFGLLFGGWQPTVIVTGASALAVPWAAGLVSSPDPQAAAVRPSPATSNRPSALRWLVLLIDLPFCCENGTGPGPAHDGEGDIQARPLMWPHRRQSNRSAQYFDH